MKAQNFDEYEDHEGYLEFQADHTMKKVARVGIGFKAWKVWEIDVISNWIREHIPDAKWGICHGVRNGSEVQAFRNQLGIEVIGTEIANLVTPNVIQWDFHKVKDDWIDSMDFVYSNSLDHSDDPEYCLDQWMKCVKQSGVCFVVWSTEQPTESSAIQPFGARTNDVQKLIEKKYKIVDTLKADIRGTKMSIFVVKHKDGRRKKSREDVMEKVTAGHSTLPGKDSMEIEDDDQYAHTLTLTQDEECGDKDDS